MSQKPGAARAEILLPFVATAAAMASFQFGAAIAKGLFSAVGPVGATTLRLVLGAAILMAMARPWRNWPKGAPILPLLGLGVSMAAAVLGFYLAISRLPLGVAIALQFLGPLAIAVAGSRRASDLLWAALAAAGVWGLVGVGGLAGAIDPLGVVFALIAATGWAGYILFGRITTLAFGRSAAAISVTIAAILIAPAGIYQAGAGLLAPAILPIAVVVALLATALPVSLEFYALPRMPARTFAVFTCLEPAFGVLAGLVMLHERLTTSQMLGVAAVIAAAAGAAWTSSARRQPAAVPLD